MPAHLREIHHRLCARCARFAKYELRNTRNAVVNWYCAKHAAAALADLKASE